MVGYKSAIRVARFPRFRQLARARSILNDNINGERTGGSTKGKTAMEIEIIIQGCHAARAGKRIV